MTQPTGNAYFVIAPHGGIYSTQLDEDSAATLAQAIEGVIVAVPITADYRTE